MRRLTAILLLCLAATPVRADEGMWPFDHVPVAAIQKQYGVAITDRWLDHLRLSTVRLRGGCTGSFISPDGLVLTNHHCAQDALVEHSTPQGDLLADGFLARTRPEELRCTSYEVDVLVGMEDVTAKVRTAIAGLGEKAANEARKRVLTQLEKACEDAARKDPKAGPLLCESVTLYQGGQYYLYKYKTYDDVRLVFAPEYAIAAFGGDPDNFQYPRWCLDLALLRVYENGQPARTPNHLRVDFAGPRDGEPVFVSGHPGSTDRLLTVEQLKTLRDLEQPVRLLLRSELRGRYLQFAKQGAEEARIVQDPLLNVENSLKVRRKELDALHDDDLFAAKRREEDSLRAGMVLHPDLQVAGDPWREIATAEAAARAQWVRHDFVEEASGFNGQLYDFARTLVRGAAERAKPNDTRLREYTDSQLPFVRQQLAAATPVYPALEKLRLAFSLERLREWLGPDDAFVRGVLGNESPDALAARVVDGTRLADPAVRRRLWDGGVDAVKTSDDPLVRLAWQVDPEARAIRKRWEDEVEAPVTLAAEKIARARFHVYETSLYPDATFTLRLNFGAVGGWLEDGVPVPSFTKLARLYERATGADPFLVPRSWLDARPALDLATPFNLSTNNDIVGGNSGSPLVNARGDLVGLLFDGNIHSIAGSYWFDPENNRAVAVHPAIVREALTKVYRAEALAREIGAAE